MLKFVPNHLLPEVLCLKSIEFEIALKKFLFLGPLFTEDKMATILLCLNLKLKLVLCQPFFSLRRDAQYF